MLNISESPSDTLAPTDVAMVISVPVIYGFSPVIFPVKINACDTGLQCYEQDLAHGLAHRSSFL
jgi:hypothetical protein